MFMKKHHHGDDKSQANKQSSGKQEGKDNQETAAELKDDLLGKIEGLTNLEQELKEAELKIREAETKAEEMANAYKRALADLENFRRRTNEEKTSFVKYACSNLLLEIFPCLDNFKKSLSFIPEDKKTENWVQGLIHSVNFFEQVLIKQGVEEMRCLGEKYNPNFHDAVSEGEGEKDIIIEELGKGYLYQGKVIKHAKVKVGNGNKGET
jgi:molecular chaperone GrpE